jgi:DMSO/TMAO reductase YedYZ heme-binding membrane subunit
VSPDRSALRSLGTGLGLVLLVTGSAAVTSYCIGVAVSSVVGNRMAPWILGRAAGITSYLLLVALVLLGLALSHPYRARWRRPSAAVRIRAHVSLSVFTLVFTVLHVVVLATDRYAGVGWWGALVPMGSTYRPLPVTLGVVALWAGLAAGVTAALAGRIPRRAWWPVHKVAIVALVLVWLHGVLSGIDTPPLLTMYVVTGGAVVAVAVSRYTSTTARADVEQLAAVRAAEVPVARLSGGVFLPPHPRGSAAPAAAVTVLPEDRRSPA